MQISSLKSEDLKSLLSMDLIMPSAYELFKKDKNKIIWFQKEIKKGSVNVLVYELPVKDSLVSFNLDKIMVNINKIYKRLGY